MQQSLEEQLKHLIVDALALEDVEPGEIETDAPLFVEGLGLDSIDALELALAIQEKFGVATSLAEFVRAQTGAAPGAAAEPA